MVKTPNILIFFSHVSYLGGRFPQCWEEERDARYFYVEQAIVSKEDKPYRQRVYKI